MKCPIDGARMAPIFRERILDKYDIDYFQCENCLLIQPESPYWLEESYSRAIAKTDVGLVFRNRSNWEKLRPLLHRFTDVDTRILDVGGGYGLLCRGLRDEGFDCYTTDSYCENLFAIDFEPGEQFRAEILLAFEVMEHIGNPLDFIREKMDQYGARKLIFSTLVHTGDGPPPRDWWYYAFETGQHISLYHKKTLQELARQLGMHLYSSGLDFHVLSKDEIHCLDRLLLLNKYGNRVSSRWLSLIRRKRSLLQRDYSLAKGDLKK